MEPLADIENRVLQSTLDEIQGSNESHEPSLDACVICLDQISEKAEAIPCRHSNFDFLCLVNWLENAPTCPLCKTAISSVRYQCTSLTEYQSFQVQTPNKRKVEDLRRPPYPYGHRRLRRRRQRPPDLPTSPDTALARRREVYEKQLYALHVGSNSYSKFQELTPVLFSHDEKLIAKAKKWIRRELRVFTFLEDRSPGDPAHRGRLVNPEFLMQYIIAIMKNVDLKGSDGQAEDMLQEFLGRQNARIFLHELREWLRSPYDSIDTWDHHVQYAEANTSPSLPWQR